MTESTGGGCMDYDRDCWQDVFFVQGGNPLTELQIMTTMAFMISM
ncbi:hypothetical protein [uncultured Rubinisphaera sp.]|tara:strand:+ start:446 stop:580 length:135 start_codon:yes stop_codon:yes gene_type:complete